MSMGAQRAEARQPSESFGEMDGESRAAIPLREVQPDLPWGGAAPEERARSSSNPLTIILAVTALGWLVVTAWATFAGGGGTALSSALQWAALASGPLALLLLVWLQLSRKSAEDDGRFASAASSVSGQSVELDRLLASIAERLDAQNGRLIEDAARLMALGDEASDRLGRVAHHFSKEGAKLEARSQALEAAAERAGRQFAALLADMPQAEERARHVAEVIGQAGLGAHAQAGALETQLTALTAHAREADEVVGGAAQRLGAQLDQSRAALDRAGDDAARGLGDRLDAMAGRIGTMSEQLVRQEEASRALIAGLGEELDALAAKFDALGGDTALDGMRAAIRGLDEQLVASGERTTELLDRARHLPDLIGAVPSELDRIEQQLGRTRDAIAAIAPDVANVADTAESAATRLDAAGETLSGQQQAIEAMLARLSGGMDGAETQLRALAAAASEADEAAGKLTASSGPELIDTLMRVRETAAQAADRAREAIAAVIPDSAAALGEASRRAMGDAVGEAVGRQLVDLEALAERTVEAARRASERLTRQMLTIGETAAAVEERIDEVNKAREKKDSESFSRRVALLIESLNSTAIDVTKILSNEVTDSAWAAYLKGDRGVFTRRAVRLIEPAEAREILAHYESEPEFREQVNRYIHDFEAMLRRVLADRESSALGVTLLGSDMGKLYVALAQAIERIRA